MVLVVVVRGVSVCVVFPSSIIPKRSKCFEQNRTEARSKAYSSEKQSDHLQKRDREPRVRESSAAQVYTYMLQECILRTREPRTCVSRATALDTHTHTNNFLRDAQVYGRSRSVCVHFARV